MHTSSRQVFNLSLIRLAAVILPTLALIACGGSSSPDDDKIEATQLSTVASARVIVPGAECPAGGIVVDSGIDENGNGELDASEVDTSEIICNGVDGADGQDGIDGAQGPTGPHGPAGADGINGQDGVNGLNGTDGADGSDGLRALVNQSVEPAGANCTNGGVRFDVGIDNNPTNGVLDAAEITATEYVCNGADGVDGIDGQDGVNGTDGIDGTNGTDGADGSDGLNSLVALSDEDPGTNCTYGGTRIESGIDNNGNDVLEASEVTDTQFICALASDSFDGLVYEADANIDGMVELYRTGRDANTSLKLIGPRIGSGDVISHQISPDRTRVAVYGDLEQDGVAELFVVSLLDGSPPIKVNGTLVAGGNVLDYYQWSPDSSRLVYQADQDTNDVYELYTVLADGTGLNKVNEALVAGGDVSPTRFLWSPDSDRLAYLADQDNDDVFELYIVLADGTGNVKVNGPLVTGGDVVNNQDAFQWSPDGSRLAYSADQDTDNVYELYTVFADGTDNVKVSTNLPGNGDVSDFSWK